MKQTGPELGNLASRFFAYIQMKKQDIVRTGDLAPVLGIGRLQERDLLRRLARSGWIVRLKRGVYLVPPRIPAGGKYSPGTGLLLQQLMLDQNGQYQVCGPTAFYFYGFNGQIPNMTHVYNNRISGERSMGNMTFKFIKVADKRLGATNTVSAGDGTGVIYPSRARALMDAVYDWSRFNSLPRGYEWIRQGFKSDRELASALVDVTARYGNQATARRIGYLLDTLDQTSMIGDRLLLQLSDSRSLIPWIPGRPEKGSVNRKWGLIVNG